jgi:hypothetical protein
LSPQPQEQPADHGEVISRISPTLYTLVFGSTCLALSLMALVEVLYVVGYFVLPFNFILFLLSGYICLGAGEERPRAMGGMLLAAVGLIISCLHLLLVNNHPWVA